MPSDKNKEEPTMKKRQTNRTGKIIPFPNAKSSRYYLDKLVDWALALVTSMGAVTALFFLILL